MLSGWELSTTLQSLSIDEDCQCRVNVNIMAMGFDMLHTILNKTPVIRPIASIPRIEQSSKVGTFSTRSWSWENCCHIAFPCHYNIIIRNSSRNDILISVWHPPCTEIFVAWCDGNDKSVIQYIQQCNTDWNNSKHLWTNEDKSSQSLPYWLIATNCKWNDWEYKTMQERHYCGARHPKHEINYSYNGWLHYGVARFFWLSWVTLAHRRLRVHGVNRNLFCCICSHALDTNLGSTISDLSLK